MPAERSIDRRRLQAARDGERGGRGAGRRPVSLLRAALLAACLAPAGAARADDATAPAAPAAATTPAATAAAATPKARPAAPAPDQPPAPRALPDYGGRGPRGTTAGEALLWVPRVVLFPVYAVTEYGVRLPLGALTAAAERHHLIDKLYDLFTFGPDHTIGIVPTGLVDSGFHPSVGFYFFYDDFLARKNALRVHGSFGGTDWLRLTVADRIPVTPRSTLKLRVEAAHRPDFVFYGVGPGSEDADRARYGSDYVDGSATYHASLAWGLTATTYLGVRTVGFRDGDCCGDPGVRELAAAGRFPLPPGFDAGYTGFRAGGRLAFDTRRPRPQPGSGVRVEGSAEYGSDLRAPEGSGWVRYGGTAGGFADVTGHNNVVSLAATALFADPVGDRTVIPFTELTQLGGTGPMSGFYPGRLVGRSAAALALEYRYPVWAFLDGSLQVAAGNVFDAHLAGFSPDNLRMSFAGGLRSSGDRDHSFNVIVGAGTETFGRGAHLDELRLLVGATEGF